MKVWARRRPFKRVWLEAGPLVLWSRCLGPVVSRRASPVPWSPGPAGPWSSGFLVRLVRPRSFPTLCYFFGPFGFSGLLVFASVGMATRSLFLWSFDSLFL